MPKKSDTRTWADYYSHRREALTESIGSLKALDPELQPEMTWHKNNRIWLRDMMDYHDNLEQKVIRLETVVVKLIETVSRLDSDIRKYKPFLAYVKQYVKDRKNEAQGTAKWK